MERIEQLLESILEVQAEILTTLREEGISIRREYSKNRSVPAMSQEEMDMLDEEIDLEWWFTSFGEEPHPAKHMDRQKLGYDSKRELDYIHKRLAEIAATKPEVNNGTHVFVNVGKKYCKTEKNTFNCFACVPVER